MVLMLLLLLLLDTKKTRVARIFSNDGGDNANLCRF
jgi:hypothetical protein